MSPDDFESMLKKAGQRGAASADGNFDLSSVSESMKNFVETVSSHEGAEFPKG